MLFFTLALHLGFSASSFVFWTIQKCVDLVWCALCTCLAFIRVSRKLLSLALVRHRLHPLLWCEGIYSERTFPWKMFYRNFMSKKKEVILKGNLEWKRVHETVGLEAQSTFWVKGKKICFCTLRTLFPEPLMSCCYSLILPTETRHLAVVQTSLHSSWWGKKNQDFHTPIYFRSQKIIKCHVSISHRHYIYALSTAIPKPICHFAFVGIQTLNFLIVFQLWFYFTITNG